MLVLILVCWNRTLTLSGYSSFHFHVSVCEDVSLRHVFILRYTEASIEAMKLAQRPHDILPLGKHSLAVFVIFLLYWKVVRTESFQASKGPYPFPKMSKPCYETVLFDMDGVLAEVSKSYREAILLTCKQYGATSVTHDTITEWKVRGNANNDWVLSRDLILSDPNGKKDVTLEEVTETFEDFYQGKGDTPGLYKLETLLPTRELLLELRKRSKGGMGIVTGRPRSDCMKFLSDMKLTDLFAACYCAGEGPSKPDPFGVRKACQDLGVSPSKGVVLIGDTPDDIRSAVAAGCSGVGVTTPEAMSAEESKGNAHTEAPLSRAMMECGADMVLLPGFAELLDYFAPVAMP